LLSGKRILFISIWSWEGAGEEAILMELLAGANEIVWVSPFGSLRGNLLPDFKPVRAGLTVYRPGVNFLPLPTLQRFNEWRRLTQVLMYLLEKDFKPDLVWLGDPMAGRFAEHFRRKGAPALYYGPPDGMKVPREEEEALTAAVDLLIFSTEKQYRRFAGSGRAVLVEAADIPSAGAEVTGAENPTDASAEANKQLEEIFMADLRERLEKISSLIEDNLTGK